MTLSEASRYLAELGCDFHRRGWVLGTSGNFSVVLERDPLRLAITASSVDKGRLAADQILEVDSSGRVLGTTPGRPSAETLLHLEILRARKAAVVLHTHSVWSTVLSDYHSGQGGFFIHDYEMLKGLKGVGTHEHREWLPILENSQNMEWLAAETARVLQDNSGLHGFLIRGHGLYTWGEDSEEAVRHIEILEFLLESVGRRQMMEPQH